MTRTLRLELAALAGIAIGLSGCFGIKTVSTPVAGAEVGNRPVNAALAQAGAVVWVNKSCYTCHAFGRRVAGPDLLGIMDRRDAAWLKRWLLETDAMILADPQAVAMVKEWKGVRMPNMKLREQDIEPLFHYMAQESARAAAARGSN